MGTILEKESDLRQTAVGSANLAPQAGQHPAIATLDAELEVAAAGLEDALADSHLPDFFELLRNSSLPYLFIPFGDDVGELFRQCFKVLHRLGSISPAVALAFENHLYLASGLATLPIADDAQLVGRRDKLLAKLVDGRLLLVNTNSHVHGKKPRSMGTLGIRTAAGYLIRGTAAYLSMATEGDLLFFSTVVDNDELTIFVVDLKSDPSIEIGDYTFPNSMIDSDTRRIFFHDTVLREENVLLSGQDMARFDFLKYTHSWHQALLTALYLGAAAGAIEEVRLMTRQLELPDGRSLAERDGLIADVGRKVIGHRTACALTWQIGDALAQLAARGLYTEPGLLEDTLNLAGAAKHNGTIVAERIVTAMRHIIGGRGFVGGQRIERLSQEVIFGVLGPDANAAVERAYGKLALGERPFLGWCAR